ncbi:alpha/beta fold hydrolase [Parahaliea aestuarii]|uniref:Alpha/beta hydrolase n=1 Tax=Parahaliea aestuarii TaxID=1852021 RepID=A0A5C8ZVS2_9GAMM|nr:alpha/beta hydrolase [Parahaliea aestuarii]TXS92623.1 alpha/beta hydrolase [Parahaliea aestuarii]
MPEAVDVYYRSDDGLKLYAYDYNTAGPDAPVLLCLHGLTRNSSDFTRLASDLSPRYRIICADQRGRGRSDYDSNPANYQPVTYVRDMFALLDHLQLPRVIVIGTSMGGLMGMMMGAMQPQRIAGLLLNDIGPEVDPAGLARIQSYVGKSRPVRNWEEALAQSQAINGAAFPDFSPGQWRDFTRGLYRNVDGVPVLAYDPAIAQPIDAAQENAVPPDLWPLFDSLNLPVLVVRGAESDILAPTTAAAMCERGHDCQLQEIPRRGHAPTLDEPAARQAIGRWLQSLGAA